MKSYRGLEPIIDSLLLEAVGGAAPPDLTANILRAWEQQQRSQQAVSASVPLVPLAVVPFSVVPSEPLPPPRVIDEQLRPVRITTPSRDRKVARPSRVSLAANGSTRARVRNRRQRSWLEFAGYSVASLAAVFLLGYVGFRASLPSNMQANRANQPADFAPHAAIVPQVAKSNSTAKSGTEGAKKQAPAAREVVATSRGNSSRRNGNHSVTANAPVPTAAPDLTATLNPPNASNVLWTNENAAANDVAAAVENVASSTPKSEESIVAFINEQLHDVWKSNGIAPAGKASDDEWCRRTYLRLIGRIPTVEEVRSFTADRSADKNIRLVDHLLNDAPWSEEYAKHWSTVWANVLLGRVAGSSAAEIASREGLESYLRKALTANRSYGRIAAELISATGTGQPIASSAADNASDDSAQTSDVAKNGSIDNFNGAANFLLSCASDDAAQATARTCRVFLGVQLQCVQCHDHPTASLRQNSFWAMNAFFRQMKVVGNRNDPRELIDQDYLGFDGRDEEGSVFFELPSGIVKVATPKFLDGTSPAVASGRVSEINRRQVLAKLVVQSPQFRQASMNRLWAQFLGFGFTRPVDDMTAAPESPYYKVLEELGDQFAAHRFDLKQAMRWITLSDAFNRSSKSSATQLADLPEAGTLPLFSRYYTRQLPAEEVIRSLQIAAKVRRDSPGGSNIEQARIDYLAQARRAAGDEAAGDGAPVEIGVVKLNASLVKHATSSAFDTMLHQVTRSDLKYEAKVEHLFLAALSRKPTSNELHVAQTLAGMNRQNEASALEDVWWAILNSNEFILDH